MFSLKDMKRAATSFSVHEQYKVDRIVNFINENVSLGKGEYKLYMQLVGQAKGANGVCFPSGEYLANKLEVSRPRIMQLVKALKDKGLLFVEKFGNHNFYIIPTIEHLENVILSSINELAKKVVSKVQETMNKVAEKAATIVDKVRGPKKPDQYKSGRNNKPGQYKKPLRTESVPDWFVPADQYYAQQGHEPAQSLDEKKQTIDEILKKLW